MNTRKQYILKAAAIFTLGVTMLLLTGCHERDYRHAYDCDVAPVYIHQPAPPPRPVVIVQRPAPPPRPVVIVQKPAPRPRPVIVQQKPAPKPKPTIHRDPKPQPRGTDKAPNRRDERDHRRDGR